MEKSNLTILKEESLQWQNSRLHYILNVIIKILTQARLGVRADILLGMLMLELEPDKPKIENNSIENKGQWRFSNSE